MIPTGKRGRAKKQQHADSSEIADLQARIDADQTEILSLKTENTELKTALKKAQRERQVFADALQKMQNILNETM